MNLEKFDKNDCARIEHFLSTLNDMLLQWEAECHAHGATGNMFGIQHENIYLNSDKPFQIKVQFPLDGKNDGEKLLGVILTIERFYVRMSLFGKVLRWRMRIDHGIYKVADKSFIKKKDGYLVGKNFPDLGSQFLGIADYFFTGKGTNLQDEQSSLVTLNTL